MPTKPPPETTRKGDLLPVTRWRITNIIGWQANLNTLLILDTIAPIVVDAIERAARDAGILMQRLEDDE